MPLLPDPPVIPTGREIYDSLMSKIEPELVTDAMPLLKEKYTNETPMQKEARRQHYNKAFEKYYATFDLYIRDLDEQVKKHHRTSMASIEELSKGSDEKELTSLQSAINSA